MRRTKTERSAAERGRPFLFFFYLLCFGLLLVGVRQRLLLGLQRGFGEEVLELVGVGDVRLLQGPPQRVVAAGEKKKTKQDNGSPGPRYRKSETACRARNI